MYRLTFLALAVIATGCTTTSTTNTARSAKEQMLVSNAIDQTLNKVDFTPFQNRTVFLNDKYIDCVDKAYLISSIRHRLLRSGATLANSADDAEIIVEARSGAIGTYSTEAFVGVPEVALPGLVTLPEMRLLEKKNQQGVAKIGLVAFDAKTKKSLGGGGMSLAQSDDSNYYFLGMGPYQNGSVRTELKQGNKSGTVKGKSSIPNSVAFAAPAQPMHSTNELQLASGEEKAEEVKPASQSAEAPIWTK